jgi:hypothetical protein
VFYLFAGSKRIATVFPDGATQFYHTNHLGSSSVITDQNGDKKEKIEYYPFGLYRAVGDPNGTYGFDSGFPDMYYTYTGQEEEDDLGLYNYGAMGVGSSLPCCNLLCSIVSWPASQEFTIPELSTMSLSAETQGKPSS